VDLLRVLWKWKYLVLFGILIFAGGATVISLQMTKVYSIQTILQPGRLKVTESGQPIFISSAETLKATIESGIFNAHISAS
jgi:uncharacterized protein involved in exopolysaccharide biosynthesis